MYTPPPAVPGTPTKMWSPAQPASAVRRAASGAGSPAPTVQRSPSCRRLVEPLPHPDDQRVEAFVGQKEVGAEADDEPGNARLVGHRERRSDVLADRGKQHRGGPADPVGRVARQRLGLPDLSPDPRAEGRREGGVARGQPVHSGDISRASSVPLLQRAHLALAGSAAR